jgi:nucleotide-binding universal stress UspA family protein
LLTLIGTFIAATITTAATVIIFRERFFEGAWTYFIFIPLLYAAFTYFRSVLGAPSQVAERLGELEEAMLGGFGFGQTFEPALATVGVSSAERIYPSPGGESASAASTPSWRSQKAAPRHIAIPLDGSEFAEHSLPAAEALSETFNARLTLISVLADKGQIDTLGQEREYYLETVANKLREKGIAVKTALRSGSVTERLNDLTCEDGVDMVVMSSHGRSGFHRWLLGGVATGIMQTVNCPVMIIHPKEGVEAPEVKFNKLLVTLDGSEYAERVLPYVKSSYRFNSVVLLLAVPEVPEAEMYGGMVEEIRQLRRQAEEQALEYLNRVASELQEEGIETEVIVAGSRPAQTIISVAEGEDVDVVMMASHGRGGLDRLFVGSVADRVVHQTEIPIFLVPIQERRQNNRINNSEQL